ncbi:Protein of unknown function [Amycolatopsis arida]|uniref:DUF3558 domain-containing protein n=1 Tax=Amycolatopsis arida TaxID=587909 RepID=A0A1I5L5Q0_9PSEU|nr:uncharacterized protein DUF3558 [Amycolatopsis arida]SFO92640.1 Protein of unknown function [Amycolatopsis arida]
MPAVLLGLALAACAGPDLGKANFPRTTVPVEPGAGGQGRAPTGPITDPAVATEALRLVDPCALVEADVLRELGQADEPRPSGWDRCATRIRDAGGKTARISLQLGDPVANARDATAAIAGLPLVEREQDDGTCFASAVTSRDPNLGISAQVTYEGGDPCRAGRTVLDKVIATLGDQPPRRSPEPGSLLGVDPCAVLDAGVMSAVGVSEKHQASGLHGCSWRDTGPAVLLDLRLGVPPRGGDGKEPVDLGGGVTGYRERGVAGLGKCTITWQHRPAGDDLGELVAVDYSWPGAEVDDVDPCGKARTLVDAVRAALPRA